jgi:hypothetical protein
MVRGSLRASRHVEVGVSGDELLEWISKTHFGDDVCKILLIMLQKEEHPFPYSSERHTTTGVAAINHQSSHEKHPRHHPPLSLTIFCELYVDV